MWENKVFWSKTTKPFGEGGERRLSKRYNEKFLDRYMEVDRLCCKKFGMATGGVTEYINRLNGARYAEGRGDVLQRLIKYRSIRNKFAHEAGAIRRSNEVSGEDVRWLKSFYRELLRKRDSISRYLRRERKYAVRRRIKGIVAAAVIGIIAVLALALYFVLQK